MGAGPVGDMMGDVARAVGRSSVRAGAMLTADLRVLPDLVVVGVKRGGTTSLFRDLERHPAMCPLVPSARRLPLRENMKGVHQFDGAGHSRVTSSARHYRSFFPTRFTVSRRAARVGAAFTAEASPYYFFHPLAAARAADALPDAVFTVMLRDPVERTVSHWAEQTRNGTEHLPLSEALAAEEERVGDDAARLADGTLRSSDAHEQQTYAAQSEYCGSYDRWVAAVGRERLVVVFAEDYFERSEEVLQALTDRIGVAPMHADGVAVRRNAAPRPNTLDPQVDAMLVDRFRPDVEGMAARLGTMPPWPRFCR